MSQSTVLPPAQPKAADLAAPTGRAAPAAGETTTDGASFGEVLQSQIDKGTTVAEAPAAVAPVPVELLIGTDPAAAAPEPSPDPAIVNALAVTVLPVVMPAVVAPVAVAVERSAATKAPPVVETTSIPGVPVDIRSETVPVVPTEVVPETGAARTRNDTDGGGTTFSRQLIAAVGGEPATQGKNALEVLEPMADAKAAAPAPLVPVEHTQQPVGAADARREMTTAAPMKVEVAQPLAAPGWRDAFADRVSWVANARQPAAEMQINPPNLGPVEIRVSMNADQASLSFFSPHAAVRDAIQAALPRLTEAFAASGLTLGNVFVGAESQSGQNPAQGDNATRYFGRSAEEFIGAEAAPQSTWLRPGAGLGRVDLFA